MTFQPIANYSSYNHILQAGAHWTHPTNGATYCCVCEQKAGARQNLCVYRMRAGALAWELVKRYQGTIDSVGHITMGGASIERSGDMLVTTSLIIPGAEKVTSTGFQGCWIREANIDEPWSASGEQGPQGVPGAPGAPGADGSDPRVDALISQLGALSQQLAQLAAGVGPPGSGGIVLLPAPRTSPAWEGRTLNGGVEVDVPAVFGVNSAAAYLIRFVASAAKADIRIRAGTKDAPYFVTLNLQSANLQSHTQGWTPGPLVWISSVDNSGTATAARVWLQLLGHAT